MKKNLTIDLAIISVILVAAMSRLIPHWPNFTPIMAIALVGGATLSSRWLSVLVPLVAMALSDLALGAIMGSGWALHGTQFVVYASVAAISALGMTMRSSSAVRTTLLGGTIAGVGFFLVTNFAVWFSGTMYPHTVEGLMACYAAGLAFYRESGNFLLNGIVSTWLFSALMFAVAYAVGRRTTHTQAVRS